MYIHIYVLRTEGQGDDGGGVGGGPEKSLTSGITIGDTPIHASPMPTPHHPPPPLPPSIPPPAPLLHPHPLSRHPSPPHHQPCDGALADSLPRTDARVLCVCVCVYTGVKLHLRNCACFYVVVCTCFIA